MTPDATAALAARVLLLSALLGVCLSPGAAERVAPPASNAASALRSMLSDAARPATDAASAVRRAVETAPRPADLAASAVKVVLEPLQLPSVAPAPTSRAAAVPIAASAASGDAGAACMRPSDQVAACQPGQQLSLTPIALPTARLGAVYKPRRMVAGGVAPYLVQIVEGSKPEGLDFSPDGSLAGRPVGPVRLHTFTVQITDSSAPPLSVRQAYALRVEQTPAPRPAASPASAAPPAAAPASAAVQSPPGPAHITSYMLLQEELDDMFPKAKPANTAASVPEAGASAPGAPRRRFRARPATMPTAHADKMQAMLAPLVHVDFPTAGLFAEALEAAHCAYFRSLVTEAAKKAKRDAAPAELKCVPTAPVAPTSAAGASSTSSDSALPAVPPMLYTELLPEVVRNDLIALAEWQHPLDGNAKPPRWSGNGCGCAPPITEDWAYGIYPFWQAQGGPPQNIDFSLFNRIGYLGAQLSNTGTLMTAMPLNSDTDGFTRTARRFNTYVDLVVHRGEWADLLSQPYQTEMIQRAVKDIVSLVDTRMTDAVTTTKRYLLPGWDEPVHLFDGVTLFFDNTPTDPDGKKKFEAFYATFVHKLIGEMQKTKRPYALNIVVPATEIGQDGAYNFEQLWGYIRHAQKLTDVNALAGAVDSDYEGTTDITVSILALLAEPTSQAKKDLRASADKKDVLHGHSRVAVLNAIAPVLFHAAGNAGLVGADINGGQMDDDIAYFKWQFGGMGLWPIPLQDTKPGPAIYEHLAKNFSPRQVGPVQGLCTWICPNRSVLRLLFMGLLVTGAVAFGLYHWVCAVRRIGRPYIVFLWLTGVLAMIVGLALLSCDPQLAGVREGNGPLVALLAIVVVVGMYYSLRPRIAPP
jgi:hypothetical protein